MTNQFQRLARAALLCACLASAACLPIPIGDPERSRVDPALSGLWIGVGHAPAIVLLQPYNKRTWLAVSASIEPGPDNERDYDDVSPKSYDEIISLLLEAGTGPDGLIANAVSLDKVWRTKLGKRRFLTWEYKGAYDPDEGFANEWWNVYRFEKSGPNSFTLRGVDPEFPGFQKAKKTRRAYERLIRRHADDDELYDGPAVQLFRVRDAHTGLILEILNEVVVDPT